MKTNDKFQPLLRQVYALNEQGGRDYNDDSIFPVINSASLADRLFMVCDGVGGSATGHIASDLICRVFAEFFRKNLAPDKVPDESLIRDAQLAALDELNKYAEQYPDSAGMASTLTLVYLAPGTAFLAWCGDSRIYHIRNGQILYQTRDHSLVQELVRRGELSPEEAETHPKRNVILRSLSAGARPSGIDVHQIDDIQAGDFILMCTDGLLENIDHNTLKSLLQPHSGINPGEALNNIAYGRTNDNYSMYLLELDNGHNPNAQSQDIAPMEKSKTLPRKKTLVPGAVFLLVCALAIYLYSKKKSPETTIDSGYVPPADTTSTIVVPADTSHEESKFRKLEKKRKHSNKSTKN